MNAKDVESEILHWDFGKDVAQTVKLQVDLLFRYIVKSVKNKEERRNRYLLPLKYLLCYVENSGLQDILKMDAAQEAKFALLLRKQMGETNVWYVEKLNISPVKLKTWIRSWICLRFIFRNLRVSCVL